MLPNADIHLIPVKLKTLRPTQMTVGYREVTEKRDHWQTLGEKAWRAALASHWFPIVLGPKGLNYIVDHHHLGMALLEEGVKEVSAMVLKDLSWLDDLTFWRMMEHNQWVHPYGADGSRYDFIHLPKTVSELTDDPYRSLAGELRRVGGYAKDATPFSEFLWADYLRPRVAGKTVEKNFAKALAQATTLAHAPEARYLPGWSGVIKT